MKIYIRADITKGEGMSYLSSECNTSYEDYTKRFKRDFIVFVRFTERSEPVRRFIQDTMLQTIEAIDTNRIIITNDMWFLLDPTRWSEETQEFMEDNRTVMIFADFKYFKERKKIQRHFKVIELLNHSKLNKRASDIIEPLDDVEIESKTKFYNDEIYCRAKPTYTDFEADLATELERQCFSEFV